MDINTLNEKQSRRLRRYHRHRVINRRLAEAQRQGASLFAHPNLVETVKGRLGEHQTLLGGRTSRKRSRSQHQRARPVRSLLTEDVA